MKLLIALDASHGWELTQMDVSNAFSHSELDEEIYMSLPQGYTPPASSSPPSNLVCKLCKAFTDSSRLHGVGTRHLPMSYSRLAL